MGVSHECDYPPQVRNKLKVTSSEISNSMSSGEIDDQVKKMGHRGPGVFHIKERLLKKLKPNFILTQELCEVCAVGFNQVKKAARVLDGDVKIISLEPEGVEDILENIQTVSQYTDREEIANKKILSLRSRMTRVSSRLCSNKNILRLSKAHGEVPKVLVIEWLDPFMIAGHWVPKMVELSGGKNLISKRGERSKIVTIDQMKSINPDILIISPCGFDIQRTIQEKELIDDLRLKINDKNLKIFLIDGNAYMTRPGPRIVDGIERLCAIILNRHANS